jgi:hypothetical protein
MAFQFNLLLSLLYYLILLALLYCTVYYTALLRIDPYHIKPHRYDYVPTRYFTLSN